jgi:transposase
MCYRRLGGMITMDQYDYIRTAHRVYGKSIRLIQRETGHDRQTIRKVLEGEPVGYTARSVQHYPALGAHLKLIDSWLEADKTAASNQRHTATRIYNRLVEEEGFSGSESSVRRYVRHAKVRLGVNAGKAFLPLDPDCGNEAEVDWGGAMAVIGEEAVRLKFFCMRSKFSGKPFVRFYACERQQAFFDAHIHAFDFFGGIFKTIIYDNLTTAVEKVLAGKRRVEQEAFRQFHAFYNFTPRFCNRGSGNEKGGVEGLVGFARRNYMVPIPKAVSIEELNERLLCECAAYGNHRIEGREETVNGLFEGEKTHLIAIPSHPFSNLKIAESKINHYATAIVDKNRYSVPTRYAGFKVRVTLGVDRVDIFHDSKRIATHRRLFGNNKWQLNPDHYLELLQQRPAAFETARPIKEWRRKWPQVLDQLLLRFIETHGETEGTRDFISVLMLYRDNVTEDVTGAVELALGSGITSSAGVKHILLFMDSKSSFEPLEGWPPTLAPDISVYGQLGGVQ